MHKHIMFSGWFSRINHQLTDCLVNLTDYMCPKYCIFYFYLDNQGVCYCCGFILFKDNESRQGANGKAAANM